MYFLINTFFFGLVLGIHLKCTWIQLSWGSADIRCLCVVEFVVLCMINMIMQSR